MFLEQWAERMPVIPCAKSEKYFIGITQIGPGIFDDASKINKSFPLSFQNRSNTAVERQTTERQLAHP